MDNQTPAKDLSNPQENPKELKEVTTKLLETHLLQQAPPTLNLLLPDIDKNRLQKDLSNSSSFGSGVSTDLLGRSLRVVGIGSAMPGGAVRCAAIGFCDGVVVDASCNFKSNVLKVKLYEEMNRSGS